MPQLTTFRLYLLGIALLFAGYVAMEYNRPKPLDWTPTYANKDKIPYGTFVLFDQLPRLLGTDSIEVVRVPAYSQLTGLSLDDLATRTTGRATMTRPDPAPPASAATDTTSAESGAVAAARDASETDFETDTGDTRRNARAYHQRDSLLAAHGISRAALDSAAAQFRKRLPGRVGQETTDEGADNAVFAGLNYLRPGRANYVFVNLGFEQSRPDDRALLRFVARGSDAFVAAESFDGTSRLLRDSLGFRAQDVELTTHQSPKGLPAVDSVDLRFTHPALARAHLRLPGSEAPQRLVVNVGRAGRTLATDAQGRAVFIRLDYGRGHFYLCTVPRAFTNYHLLRPRNAAFAAGALAYLPARRTWWDEYQKQGPVGEQSLLRVVFAHEALRLAYYLVLAGGLLFVLVEARRRQRIIPTLKALPNTTLLFTRTVASLYRQGSNHALIAEKKVGLFMDYLRTRFQENSPDFGDADFRERLSLKSGVPRPRVDELLRQVNFARTAPQMNDHQLLQLSRALSDFKREAR